MIRAVLEALYSEEQIPAKSTNQVNEDFFCPVCCSEENKKLADLYPNATPATHLREIKELLIHPGV